jgi:hypothetical protein
MKLLEHDGQAVRTSLPKWQQDERAFLPFLLVVRNILAIVGFGYTIADLARFAESTLNLELLEAVFSIATIALPVFNWVRITFVV